MPYVLLPVEVVGTSPDIITVVMTDGPRSGKQVQFPRSVCADPTLISVGDDEIEVADWLCTKEGLL